jgi:hypothetical protein
MSIPVVPLGPASTYALYNLVEAHMLTYPDVTIRHTKTQTAFSRKVQFAWVTQPLHKADMGGIQFYLSLPFVLDTPHVVRYSCPSRERYMHQFVLRSPTDFDDELKEWIALSWSIVGPGRGQRAAVPSTRLEQPPSSQT